MEEDYNLTLFDRLELIRQVLSSAPEDGFMSWYIETRDIQLCELYYPPYDFSRTGCMGCPYGIHLRKDLDMMKRLIPAEYKQACLIWGPVYDEMEKINYRKMKGYNDA